MADPCDIPADVERDYEWAKNLLARHEAEDRGIYEYIRIVKYGTSTSGKTSIYGVLNKRSGDLLGGISWYGPWRQYTFNPHPCTTYSAGCLRDIAEFIETARKGGA